MTAEDEVAQAELEERARKLLTGKVEFLLSAPKLEFLPDPVAPEIAFAGVVLLATTAGVVRVRMRRTHRVAA